MNNYYWNNKTERAREARIHTLRMEDEYPEDIKRCMEKSIVYSPTSTFNAAAPKRMDMQIHLVSEDSVTALSYQEGKTAVLNFASYKVPGGKFLEGSQAQEESLCHNSFLFNVLRKFTKYYEWNNNNKNRGLYKNRAIYSPDIVFNIPSLNELRCADVITCAAPNVSVGRRYGWDIEEDNLEALDSRIKFVLDIAAENEVETLILGAYGCGVFGQDPKQVAALFMKHLATHAVFKRVIFAIPNNFHAENYEAFCEVIRRN